MKKLTVIVAVLFSIAMWSCSSGSNSLSGEYVCTKHYSEPMVSKIKLEFNEDGTCVSVTEFANIEGTYKIKGDSVYMFSDGYVDQFGGEKQMKFKSKQFKQTLLRISDLPMRKQANQLELIIEKWMGDTSQIDDVLVMGIKL